MQVDDGVAVDGVGAIERVGLAVVGQVGPPGRAEVAGGAGVQTPRTASQVGQAVVGQVVVLGAAVQAQPHRRAAPPARGVLVVLPPRRPAAHEVHSVGADLRVRGGRQADPRRPSPRPRLIVVGRRPASPVGVADAVADDPGAVRGCD